MDFAQTFREEKFVCMLNGSPEMVMMEFSLNATSTNANERILRCPSLLL